jgi:hypothetical protein
MRIPLSKLRAFVAILCVFLALFLAGPALAEYLGPDRVTVEFKEVRDPDHDVWTLTHVDPSDGFSDVCLIIHTCEEHPSVERQQVVRLDGGQLRLRPGLQDQGSHRGAARATIGSGPAGLHPG